MFKKSSLLLSLLIISPIIANNNQPERSELGKWGNLSLNYLITLPISGMIGALTGGLCGMFCADYTTEPKIKSLGSVVNLMIMLTEISTRDMIVQGLQKDLDGQQIAHNKTLMTTTAWICSWIAFLKVLSNKLPLNA